MANQNAVSRLLSGLRSEYHDFKPSLQVFPDLSPDKIARNFNLAGEGADRGKQGEPARDSATLDEFEMRVVAEVETHRNASYDSLIEEMRVYQGRIASLDFEGRFSDIRNAAPEAVVEFRAEALQGRNELFTLRRQVKEVEDERDDFKRTHRLNRVSRHAKGGMLTLKVGFLGILVLIEILLNGYFLSIGSDMGWLGGIAEAVTFALLNVVVSFGIAGVGVRRINQRHWFAKAVGLLSLLFYVSFAIGLNLILAHYREVSGEPISNPGHEVMVRLLSTPFAFNDVKTVVFFAVGIAFSLMAFGDAFLVFDPYPGYGPLEGRVHAAHENYGIRYTELVERLKEIKDDAIGAMEEANRDLSVRRGQYDEILQGRTRLVQLFARHQDSLERATNTMLTVYREANTRNRPAGTAPVRFQTSYKMDRLPVSTDPNEATAREDLRKSIRDAQNLLVEHVRKIHEEFERALHGYQEVERIVAGEGKTDAPQPTLEFA